MAQREKIEIMAPAGSYAALAAAIRSGADSVYFGAGKLNMRARSADAFTAHDLGRIARICRWCGVRSYLALNSIVYDEELADVESLCAAARAAGVSAVIAADAAVMRIARAHALEVHLSTQVNISNYEALRFYAQFADVVVLARELTLEQIRALHERIVREDLRGPGGGRVRIELFVHGALCVAVSGKCYMSLAQYNASGNRGSCYQSCRRRYRVEDAETGESFEIDNEYVMSPKDLCTVRYLDKIIEAGAEILKIEGRGRSPDYVAETVAVYREALECREKGGYADGPPEAQLETWMRRLHRVFNRGFWEGGYYCGRRLNEWAGTNNSSATRRRVQLGRVSNYYARPAVAEFKLCHARLDRGAELLFHGPTTGSLHAVAEELRVEGESRTSAAMHEIVTVPVPAKVRRGDKVFAWERRKVLSEKPYFECET
ncbi:peptidase U32 family protein [Kiritimatiella glycovorans]|nr:peptidase U32 family protein [Kiritimatiella glycovorans]